MSDVIRIGGNKSRDHRSRKNPAAHEAWMKAKKVGRLKQIHNDSGYVKVLDVPRQVPGI